MSTNTVEIYKITNNVLRDYFNDLSNQEGKKIFKPMNCISWMIGHLACINYNIVARNSKNRSIPDINDKFGNGSPHFQPEILDVISLWETSVRECFAFLDQMEEEDLKNKISDSKMNFNLGTDISRLTFHAWNHMGEIAAVRQFLGKDPGNPGYGKWDWRY